MTKNLVSGLILASLAQIWATKIFPWILPLLDVRRCCKLSLYAISRKTNEKNLRKWQKTLFQAWFWPLWPKFGPKNFFSWILSLLDVRHCCKLSAYVISGKTKEQYLRKWQRPSFGSNFGPLGPNSGCQNFSSKIWLCQSLDVMVSYHHVQYQKKLMNKSCETLVTDGRTDRQTGTRVIW